ncbi:hypothetical protein QFC22_002138 [Naganishia vaughanmartiniae]|uniref:Uncharacterized protein n=1 Tax=Naganishia vaughanmartiniae TaxID=1424756 RepID=A0ACC2XD41_9TREE|nr:hypothetical protein QFC22_002138 [Naganishia vaughanmartiniae]
MHPLPLPHSQLLESLGYSSAQLSSSDSNIIDVRPTSTSTQQNTLNNDDDDTLAFLKTLLAESSQVAVETYGAASFCVGNISDDPDIEDVALILGSGDDVDVWKMLGEKLGLDLSNVCDSFFGTGYNHDEPHSRRIGQFTNPSLTSIDIESTTTTTAIAADQPAALPPLIKGTKLYNLLASLNHLQKITVSSRDEGVLLVAFIGERRGVRLGLLGVAETT